MSRPTPRRQTHQQSNALCVCQQVESTETKAPCRAASRADDWEEDTSDAGIDDEKLVVLEPQLRDLGQHRKCRRGVLNKVAVKVKVIPVRSKSKVRHTRPDVACGRAVDPGRQWCSSEAANS